MAIVPFVIDGQEKNIVSLQEDFDINGTNIRMKDLDTKQLQKEDEANTSYDLRVGSEYLDHRESSQTALIDGGKIKLRPGSAVIIQTAEYVHFPKTRFGQIVPKVGLLRKGISNTTSKIDPGYNGTLLITVFNLGKNTVFLEKGERFCTLVVQEVLNKGIRHYNKSPKQLNSNPKNDVWKRIKDFVKGPYWGVVSFFITIFIAILALFK